MIQRLLFEDGRKKKEGVGDDQSAPWLQYEYIHTAMQT